MSDVTRILSQIESGDPSAAELLLPFVYHELRKLAQEKPRQTLQATVLVEVYLRLLGGYGQESSLDNRGLFFASAAEAMRQILVGSARKKRRLKRGGDHLCHEFAQAELAAPTNSEDVFALDEAITDREAVDPLAAELVKPRYFAGLTFLETARVLGRSQQSANASVSSERLLRKSPSSRIVNLDRGCLTYRVGHSRGGAD